METGVAQVHNVPPLPQRRTAAGATSRRMSNTTNARSLVTISGHVATTAASTANQSSPHLPHLDRGGTTESRSRILNDYHEELDVKTDSASRQSTLAQSTTTTTQVIDVLRTTTTVTVDTKESPPSGQSKTSDLLLPKSHGVVTCRETIICRRCGRCRCAECAALPTCRCYDSARRVVDVCSCVCCVGACFHRCRHRLSLDDDDEPYGGQQQQQLDVEMEPCACGPPQPACCRRWTLLMVLSACLPCLWLYWPLRWTLGACDGCYSSCARSRGCRCAPADGGRLREPLVLPVSRPTLT